MEALQETIDPKDEKAAIASVVRNAIYICMHLDISKPLFDPLGADSLCSGGICITDISESPLSFVVEEANTKSYVYYNSKNSKVKYVCKTHAALNMLASGVEGMRLQLDAKIDEEMKEMTAEIKQMILKKIEREVARSNLA